MSGRAWSQQGLATTCKDSGLTGELEGPERDKVWRVSLYERRRRGNALRGDLRGRPDGSVIGQRGSGHSAAVGVLTQPDTVLDICGRCGTAKGWSKLLRGLGCERAGVSPKWLRGKARPDKCPAEPRPEPDSRNATVRDHRGASGDVAHGGTRTPPRNRKGEAGNAPPTGARAWDLSRREQESPVLETSTPGLMRRGLETGPGRPYTGTKPETAETAKGSLPVPRQSSTLPRESGPPEDRYKGTPPFPLLDRSPASKRRAHARG